MIIAYFDTWNVTESSHEYVDCICRVKGCIILIKYEFESEWPDNRQKSMALLLLL